MKKLIAWLGVVCCIAAVSAREEIYGLKHDLEKSETLTRTVAALERILDDGTIIRFTADSLFEKFL